MEIIFCIFMYSSQVLFKYASFHVAFRCCRKAFKIDVIQPVYQQIALKKGIVSADTLFH